MANKNILKSSNVEFPTKSNGSNRNKASFLLKFLAVLFTLSSAILLVYLNGLQSETRGGSILMSLITNILGVCFLSFIFVGLFQVSKSFRNQRSRYKIYTWVSGLITFSPIIILVMLQLFGLVNINPSALFK